MQIELFAMERMQSTYENEVELNLSESGVHPLRVAELVEEDRRTQEELLAQELCYTQSNGTPELREAISALYPGASAAHIEVTNGGSEANHLVLWHLVEPGDEVIMMLPNYMQVWGLARAYGATVRPWWLREQTRPARWAPDLDELRSLAGPRTRAIVICNPNNPTGARLTEDEVAAVCETAARHGAWVVADEIYRGAERDARETPSAWGRYERVIVTSGLSKAYGLPGLRIGWIAGPPDFVAACWSFHDYTTIAPGAVSDRLARVALDPERRGRILARTRGIIAANYPIVKAWIDAHGDAFSHIAPEAGAIAYLRYRHAINSTELADRLRVERSVLVVPGDHFQMDGYVRIGFGSDAGYLKNGLARIRDALAAIPADAVL